MPKKRTPRLRSKSGGRGGGGGGTQTPGGMRPGRETEGGEETKEIKRDQDKRVIYNNAGKRLHLPGARATPHGILRRRLGAPQHKTNKSPYFLL